MSLDRTILFSFSLFLLGFFTSLNGKSSNIFYPIKGAVDRSFKVVSLRDQKVLHSERESLVLSPASITKLITSAALLNKFSPNFVIKTPLLYVGTKKGDTIHGKIIIKGNGDPLIINEKLWQLASDLKHMGIKKITKGLIIDNSYFNDAIRDSSRKNSTKISTHAYDAPITPFGVNFNTFTVAIYPSDRIGKNAHIQLDPHPVAGVKFIGKIKTVAKNKKSKFKVVRISEDNRGLSLKISGSIAMGSKLQKVYRSVRQPVWSSGEQFRGFLKGASIQLLGEIKKESTPKNAKFLMNLEGYNLGYIVKSLNKFSNNYIADVLTKKLGEETFPSSKTASMEKGVSAINQFLTLETKIKSPFLLKNGSGLDYNNKLSADDLIKVLVYMHSKSELFPEFLTSLPVSGVDGTLKKRFNHKKTKFLKGIIRAKTGTLTKPVSVSGLSGIFNHPKKGLIAFCIIENGKKGLPQPNILQMRKRQDHALANIYQKLNKM